MYSNLTRQANKAKTVLKLGSSSDPDYNTGSILWDTNKENILYASSEPVEDDQAGIHKVFDVKKGRETVKLRVNEAGDAMALDNNHGGGFAFYSCPHRSFSFTCRIALALATKGEGKHFLRLFDVRRLQACHTQEIVTKPFSPPTHREFTWNAEVSSMTFSPDGVYLALSRSDNSVHLYDSRMIGKGVMQEYRHDPARFVSQSQEVFGVTRVQWISAHSGQYSLLSGGEDGKSIDENV